MDCGVNGTGGSAPVGGGSGRGGKRVGRCGTNQGAGAGEKGLAWLGRGEVKGNGEEARGSSGCDAGGRCGVCGMAGWMGGPASSKLSDVYESGIPLRCGTGLRLVFMDERWGNVENGIGQKLSSYYIPIYSCTHVLMSSCPRGGSRQSFSPKPLLIFPSSRV